MTIISTPRIKDQTMTVRVFRNVSLKINYYWDSHGELINWNNLVQTPTFWSKANVQIRRHSFTEVLLNKLFDFTEDQLVVNDRLIPGDLINYIVDTDTDGNVLVTCDLAIGWG